MRVVIETKEVIRALSLLIDEAIVHSKGNVDLKHTRLEELNEMLVTLITSSCTYSQHTLIHEGVEVLRDQTIDWIPPVVRVKLSQTVLLLVTYLAMRSYLLVHNTHSSIVASRKGFNHAIDLHMSFAQILQYFTR